MFHGLSLLEEGGPGRLGALQHTIKSEDFYSLIEVAGLHAMGLGLFEMGTPSEIFYHRIENVLPQNRKKV